MFKFIFRPDFVVIIIKNLLLVIIIFKSRFLYILMVHIGKIS